jgi:hypothetical protein
MAQTNQTQQHINQQLASQMSLAQGIQAQGIQAQTINQQLSTHLANQMNAAAAAAAAASHSIKLPAPKRKRGSLDSPLTGFKMKHNIMHATEAEVKRIGFIGAGNMARAIVEGWVSGGGCGFQILHVHV